MHLRWLTLDFLPSGRVGEHFLTLWWMHSSIMLLVDIPVSVVDPNLQVCLKYDSVNWSQTIQRPAKTSTNVLTNMVAGPKSLFFLMQSHEAPESFVGGTALPWESVFAEDPPLILVVSDFLERKLIHLTFDHRPLCGSHSEQFQRFHFVQALLKDCLAPYVLPSTCLSVNLEECHTPKIHFVASSTK